MQIDTFSPNKFLTRNLKIGPFLRGATEVVDVLEEITAAGHDKLITAFLCVAAGVKFHRKVDGSRDVHLVLKRGKDATRRAVKLISKTNKMA